MSDAMTNTCEKHEIEYPRDGACWACVDEQSSVKDKDWSEGASMARMKEGAKLDSCEKHSIYFESGRPQGCPMCWEASAHIVDPYTDGPEAPWEPNSIDRRFAAMRMAVDLMPEIEDDSLVEDVAADILHWVQNGEKRDQEVSSDPIHPGLTEGLPGEFPRYKSFKIVEAFKIIEIKRHNDDIRADPLRQGRIDLIGIGSTHTVNDEWIRRHLPIEFHDRHDASGLLNGYVVFYKDGYVSWSPAAAFEEGYAAV